MPIKKNIKKIEVKNEINPKLNYSIAAEWTVNGVKWITLRNNDNNEEVVFEESSPPVGVSIIKKNLMYYTITIGNQEIKVSR